MKILAGLAIGLALLASGCAAVTRGTSEDVKVDSKPRGAVVTTSLGLSCPRTPCTIKVPRRSAFTAYASKPGYRKGQIEVKTKLGKAGAAALAGNIILPGGTAGAVIDVVSGAALDHIPNPAVIVLKPGGRKSAGKPTRHRMGRKTPVS